MTSSTSDSPRSDCGSGHGRDAFPTSSRGHGRFHRCSFNARGRPRSAPVRAARRPRRSPPGRPAPARPLPRIRAARRGCSRGRRWHRIADQHFRHAHSTSPLSTIARSRARVAASTCAMRMDQRQRRLALGKIVAEVLAQRRRRRRCSRARRRRSGRRSRGSGRSRASRCCVAASAPASSAPSRVAAANSTAVLRSITRR